MSNRTAPRTTQDWEGLLTGLSHPDWATETEGPLTVVSNPERPFAHVYPQIDEFGDPYNGDADAIAATPDALRELVRLRHAIDDLAHQYILSLKKTQSRFKGSNSDELTHTLLKHFITDLDDILAPERTA